MLSKRQVEQYLKRINVNENLSNTSSTLMTLHQAHLRSVPFENLDIHLGHKINLSLPLLFDKIVTKNRGGFCYELNYLFSALLHACGFKFNLLSAQVFDGNVPGREFDHLLLLVECEDVLWIADVGFGDSFISPIKLDNQSVEQLGYMYKVTSQGGKHVLFRKKLSEEWLPQYIFSLTPQKIKAFEEMCEFQQTSSESSFTKKSVCSIATQYGRLTISNGKFIETSNGIRSERLIANNIEYRQILKQYFCMQLPDDVSPIQWNKLGITPMCNK
jgi:N-hydroxyarylamine O-acetyltransferase